MAVEIETTAVKGEVSAIKNKEIVAETLIFAELEHTTLVDAA